jgi:signal transduction histidine kinase
MEIRNLNLVGYLTWLIVGVSSVYWEWQRHSLGTPRAIAWMVSFCCFLLFYRVVRTGGHTRMIVCLILQTVIALVCVALQPVGFQPILLVIVAGQLGSLSVPVALSWVVLQTAALGAVMRRHDEALAISMAFFAFAIFASFTARIAHNEREARRALAETHAELKVATELLGISSRTEERLRISRDLHDLMGHHLTALSLNLEVASHLSGGAARDQIETGKSLTKLLLSDVRDVVSRLREDESVDLAAAVQSLRDIIATPALHLAVGEKLGATGQAVATVSLRAIQEIVTNAVRHSEARNLWLSLTSDDDMLQIDARDDGRGCDHVAFGNGLRGMQERIEEAGGTMVIDTVRGSGFKVHVRLPLKRVAA